MVNRFFHSKWILAIVAIVSLGFLSGHDPAGTRRIACVDPTSPESLYKDATSVPIPGDLFGRVRTEAEQEAFKKSALDMYNFLTVNEMRYYVDTRAAYNAYGIKGPLFNFFAPTTVAQLSQFGNFGFMPGPQLTNLWSSMFQPQSLTDVPGLMGAVSPVAQMALTSPGQAAGAPQPAAIPLKLSQGPQVTVSVRPAAAPSIAHF